MQEKKESFNQRKYINEWRKEKKLQFRIDLDKDEKIELDKLLKAHNLTKVDFVRLSIKALKDGKIKK